MRLIDGTIQALLLTNYILERKEAFIRTLEKGDNDFLFAMMMDYFDSQPTAYDTDKVVAELKEVEADCLEMYDWQGQSAIIDAIDIVKRGGVE